MCTTFLCYKLVKWILKQKTYKSKLLDYPNLIRLNPNIPWKTRGNASLVIRLRSSIPPDELFETCRNFVLKFATSPKANSGLVMLADNAVPDELQDFSKRALSSVLGLREARKLISNFHIDSFGLRSQQGLVGALAGIGNRLGQDHTFELIAYKQDPHIPRKIESSKIISMSFKTFPKTFSNYDQDSGRIMIMPHGLDPVLCGIRGETARDVKHAFETLRPLSNLGGWMIFRTNQGTGEHLNDTIEILNPKVYHSGKMIATVTSKPKAEIGGHVFFTVGKDFNNIRCACYEPTGEFRRRAMDLIPGDIIEIGGGVRKPTALHSVVLNLEYFKPIKLASKLVISNPMCPSCGVSLVSRGRDKGFKCSKCGHASRTVKKSEVKETRTLRRKMYLPPIAAHRHLTKPLHRFMFNKRYYGTKLIDDWIN